MKPHLVMKVIAGRPVSFPRGETKLERAQRVYGRAFGRENWTAGSGPRYWTDARIASLREQNEENRLRKLNAAKR